MPEPLALTLDDAAAALAVSPRTIRRLLAAGELEALRIGRALRVKRDSLHAFVDKNTIE